MLYAVLAGFAVIFLLPLIYLVLKKNSGYLLTLLPLSIFVYFLHSWYHFPDEGVIHQIHPWNEGLGLYLSFYLDGFSLFMALLISGIGTLIFFYAAYYMKKYNYFLKFFAFIIAFMSAMLGLVLSDNIYAFVVFWEITSISSYMLIGLNHENKTARDSALQGLLVTGLGGLMLMGGLVLLHIITGTTSISEMVAMQEMITGHSTYLMIMILLFLGAFTKSAQFPFHFWLPNAMAAPTPVSAYLHSATMVKAGVFLLARFTPIMGTAEWHLTITIIGAITMFTGAFLALREVDVKKILAYSTISALGTLTLLLGISHNNELAIKAFMVYLLAHALYKASLFMTAGIIDKQTGTRDVRALRPSIYRLMPVTSIIAVFASFSLAGVPPFVGFISKELLYEAVIFGQGSTLLLAAAVLISGATMFVVMVVLSFRIFFFGAKMEEKKIREASPLLYMAPLIPAALSFIFGLFPGMVHNIMDLSINSLAIQPVEVKLTLWHGFNIVLLLSGLTIVAGIGIYRVWSMIQQTLEKTEIITRYGPGNLYFMMLIWLKKYSLIITDFIQMGNLRTYVRVTVLTFLFLTGYSFFRYANLDTIIPEFRLIGFDIILGLIMLGALAATLLLKVKISAVITMGVISIIISIIFLLFGAPDLAITLFLIDTFTVILFALVINKIPSYVLFKNRSVAIVNLVIALATGALISLILLTITTVPLESGLRDWYSQASLPLAHGRNIVNVILVDFRAIDTFGELMVLAIAAIGVLSLYKLSMEEKTDKL